MNNWYREGIQFILQTKETKLVFNVPAYFATDYEREVDCELPNTVQSMMDAD